MTIEDVIYSRLKGFTGVNTYVGVNDNARIYPSVMPPKTAEPAITYQIISENRTSAMGQDTGLVDMRLQVDVFSKTYQEASDLMNQVRLCLQRWSNTSGTVVQDTLPLNHQTLYEKDAHIFHHLMDFRVFYEE